MNVQDCMTTDPLTAYTGMNLREALDMMRRSGMRHLPVVAEGMSYLGIIKLCDVESALAQVGDDADGLGVDGVIELCTPALRGDESTDDVWALLARSPGLTPLPIVRDGILIGTVSQHELLRAMACLPQEKGKMVPEASMVKQWVSRILPPAPR